MSSPFIRHGAVVRCGACDNRYRIKSGFVSRTITTGPKTVDEMDPLLRGDSVDLEADEVGAPVQIDADGNVVGLSGLSELMRQSDAAHAQAEAIARTRASEDAPPPAARIARPASAPRASRKTARHASRRKRSKPNGLIIAAALLVLAVTVGLLAVVLSMLGGNTDPAATGDPVAQNPTPNNGTNNPTAVIQRNDPDLFPDTPGTNNPDHPGGDPDGQPQTPGDADPSRWMLVKDRYEPNPDNLFTLRSAPEASPIGGDIPTVLASATPLVHEGWYITTPPRQGLTATGASDVVLSTLTPAETPGETGAGDTVYLEGDLLYQGPGIALRGEAHVALLDASGRIFAETYLPFVALQADESRRVRLAIPSRHWARARDVRTSATVFDTVDEIVEMEGVVLTAAGQDSWASARITMQNDRDNWLRDAMILLSATDAAGRPVARFMSMQEDLYIEPAGWLDIVLHTPLPPAEGELTWRVQVIER